MPEQRHPRLLELDALAQEPDPEAVVITEPEEQPEVSTPDPSSPATESSETEVASAPVVDAYSYNELARKWGEDPAFRNTFNSLAGRRLKREWEPRLRELEAELTVTKQELQRERLGRMLPQEIEEKFASDKAFATEYTDYIHRPAQQPDLMDEVRRTNALDTAINEAITGAESMGVPADRLAQWEQSFRGGYFKFAGYDTQGKPQGQELPFEAQLTRWVSALNQDAYQHATARQAQAVARALSAPTAATPVVEPAPAPVKEAPRLNPKMADPGPDLASGTSRATSVGKIRLADYMALTPPEKAQMFKTQGEFIAALNAGIVYSD